jgi:hypothetical protein
MNVAVEWLPSLLPTLKVLGSNLARNTYKLKDFRGLSQSLKTKAGIVR